MNDLEKTDILSLDLTELENILTEHGEKKIPCKTDFSMASCKKGI